MRMRLIIKGIILNFLPFPQKRKKYFGSLSISKNTGPVAYVKELHSEPMVQRMY